MEDGNVYVYDFSELREEVKAIETQISELVSVQSEQVSMQSEHAEMVQTQISALVSAQSEQASEMVSVMSEAAEINTEIKSYTQTETILLFAIIGFIGVVCGVVGALTWRSNK